MMQPESAQVEGRIIVIRVRINVCQKTRIIEELICHPKALQMEMFQNMYRELEIQKYLLQDEHINNWESTIHNFGKFIDEMRSVNEKVFKSAVFQMSSLERAITTKR